jgi:hypothetical protein
MDRTDQETDRVIKVLKRKRNILSYILIVVYFVCDLLVLISYSVAIQVSDWANANNM